MNNTNNLTARESFRIAKGLLFSSMRNKFDSDAECQAWVDATKLSQSEIRLEVPLTATSNNFQWAVLQSQTSTGAARQFVTEQRLEMQDTLICSEFGIFVGKADDDDDTEFLLRTYGNTQDFTAAAAAALDGGFFCNGAFQIKVNNDVIAPYRGLFNHWYKPQTQQTDTLGVGSPGDQIRGAEDGMITCEPNILVIGSKNYRPQIVLPRNLSTVDEGTRAILIMRGILAQNSTVVN